MSLRPAAFFLSSAISRMVSMDSCFARSMNAQVFTTSTSACAASAVISCPSFSAIPSITSESTRFLGHPKDTNPIFTGTTQCSILPMRAHFLAAVVALLGFAGPVAAQDTSVPPRERIINLSVPVRTTVSDCTVPSAVARLARHFHVVVGVEYLKSECARIGGERRSDGELIDLKGLTIEDAFAKLLAMDPRYQMIEREGVFVLRPVQAWADPKNMLNFTSGSFT